jgi:hypothetical protein
MPTLILNESLDLKLQDWKRASSALGVAENNLTRAATELRRAINEFAGELLPDNAMPGEVFTIPIENEFIQIQYLKDGPIECPYLITIRK